MRQSNFTYLMRHWDPNRTALDLLLGRYNESLTEFLDSLTTDQLRDLLRALDQIEPNPKVSFLRWGFLAASQN